MGVLWIILLATEFYLIYANPVPHFDGNCYCAMFRSNDNPKWDDPLLVSNPHIPIPHNVAGARSCLRICNALFIASESNAGRAICDVLQEDVKNFYVIAYFRLCNEETWASTKTSNKEPICCRKGKKVDC